MSSCWRQTRLIKRVFHSGRRSSHGHLVKPAKWGAEPQNMDHEGNPVDAAVQVFFHFLFIFFNQNQKAHRIRLEIWDLTADSTHINTDRRHSSSCVRGEKDSKLEKTKNALAALSHSINKLDWREPFPGKKKKSTWGEKTHKKIGRLYYKKN